MLYSKVDSFGHQLQSTTQAFTSALNRVQQLEAINEKLSVNMDFLNRENSMLMVRVDTLDFRAKTTREFFNFQ